MNNREFKKKYKKELFSPEWIAKRKEIIKRDDFTCQKCGEKEELHVHHIEYLDNLNPQDYPNEYLITLCSECHRKEHGINKNANKRYVKLFIDKIDIISTLNSQAIIVFCYILKNIKLYIYFYKNKNTHFVYYLLFKGYKSYRYLNKKNILIRCDNYFDFSSMKGGGLECFFVKNNSLFIYGFRTGVKVGFIFSNGAVIDYAEFKHRYITNKKIFQSLFKTSKKEYKIFNIKEKI